MESRPVKAIIVEDNIGKAHLVADVLPDYVQKVCIRYEKAKLTIETKPDTTTVVIMYAEEKSERSLSIFSWICDVYNGKRGYIPVVLITEDAYSDNAFKFMDLGEAFFYEGEVNDSDFYNVFCEAVDSADDFQFSLLFGDASEHLIEPEEYIDESLVEEPEEEDYYDEFEATHGISKEDKKVMAMIMALTGDNMERALNLKKVLEETIRGKIEAQKKKHSAQVAINRPEMVINPNDINSSQNSSAVLGGGLMSDFEAYMQAHRIDQVVQLNDFLTKPHVFVSNHNANNGNSANMSMGQNTEASVQVEAAIQNNMNGPQKTRHHGVIKKKDVVVGSDNNKKKILIVDPDPMTLKACELFFEDKYELLGVESNMKAVDFFHKNYADVVLIENDMPYLKGPEALDTIRKQPFGMYVKGIILVDGKKTRPEKEMIRNAMGVWGVVEKPIIKKNLLKTIESCFVYQ